MKDWSKLMIAKSMRYRNRQQELFRKKINKDSEYAVERSKVYTKRFKEAVNDDVDKAIFSWRPFTNDLVWSVGGVREIVSCCDKRGGGNKNCDFTQFG